MSNWQTAFPDYPATEMVGVPDGFIDTSWENDICPSFTSDVLGLTIWVDYPHAADREYPEWARFRVTPQDHGVETSGEGLEADDWSEVLAFIAARTLSDES